MNTETKTKQGKQIPDRQPFFLFVLQIFGKLKSFFFTKAKFMKTKQTKHLTAASALAALLFATLAFGQERLPAPGSGCFSIHPKTMESVPNLPTIR
jgi:hypothetical protein